MLFARGLGIMRLQGEKAASIPFKTFVLEACRNSEAMETDFRRRRLRSLLFERLRLGARRRREVRNYFQFSTFEVSEFRFGNAFRLRRLGALVGGVFALRFLDFSDFLNGLNPRTAKKETFEGNRRRRVARRPEGLLAPTFILAAISS